MNNEIHWGNRRMHERWNFILLENSNATRELSAAKRLLTVKRAFFALVSRRLAYTPQIQYSPAEAVIIQYTERMEQCGNASKCAAMSITPVTSAGNLPAILPARNFVFAVKSLR